VTVDLSDLPTLYRDMRAATRNAIRLNAGVILSDAEIERLAKVVVDVAQDAQRSIIKEAVAYRERAILAERALAERRRWWRRSR
jgi:hypothetical protein